MFNEVVVHHWNDLTHLETESQKMMEITVEKEILIPNVVKNVVSETVML
jgi:hypothetical protein